MGRSLHDRQVTSTNDGEGKKEIERGRDRRREGHRGSPLHLRANKQTQVQKLLPPPDVWSIMVQEYPDSGAKRPQFQPWLCHLPFT